MRQHETDIATLFQRMAHELNDLHDAGRRVEDTVADMIAQQADAAPASLQQIDETQQRIADLATFAHTLADTDPAGRIDLGPAIGALKLARMRAALSGEESQADPDADEKILF